jgi:diguanylate cyclase (GGDEF)-like protein
LTSIRNNILAFAVLATLIPSLGLGLLSFWRYQDVINKDVRHELRSIAKDAGGETTAWLRERAHELRTLATAYTLIDGFPGGAPRPKSVRIGAAELEHYLQSVQRKLEPLLELTLLDTSGQVIASSSASPASVTLPVSWPNSAVSEGVIVTPPHRDAAMGAATLTLAVPVLSLRNELVGALAAVIDLSTVTPRLRDAVGPGAAEIVVLATDGTPLISTQSPAADLTPIDAESLLRLRGQAGEPLTFKGFHGREVLGVAAPPRTVPIIVVAQRDRAEVFGAWLDLLELYVLLVAGLTLLVGVVAYWFGRSIVAPLDALTAAADRIARGDLSVALRDDVGDEIGRLTRVFNLMVGRVRESREHIETANDALRRQKLELETLATTDSLTGLANRRKLDAFLVEEFGRFQIHHKPFALLMIEIDNLDAINADYGFVTGDEVLVKIAALLRQAVRAVDQVARFGGEKFVAVLPDTPFDAAVDVAEHVRFAVEAPGFRSGTQDILVTLSLGVAQSRDGDAGPETILFRADHALHEARRAGGNRVQSAM